MKTLNLHCDSIEFKALKKALKNIDDLAPNQNMEGSSKECLVVLISIEKGDGEKSVPKLVQSIKDIATQLFQQGKADPRPTSEAPDKRSAPTIVLYPYAHLSKNLGSPETAIKILNKTAEELKDFQVIKAPFGYYKQFEIKVKGHPLSELSREIKGEESAEEPELSIEERNRLLKAMTKNKTQSIRGNNDLKSNVELGKELDLYIINEVVGKGLPLFTPKGTSILRRMRRFIEDEELKRGYEYTQTPIMAKSDLYKISGHWQHYKSDMFVLDVYGKDYALRPMTCPFQFVLFKRKPRTYKDLPKKYAEIATLYRKEQTGELRGLTRMWQFNLADAHILCTEEQIENEFEKVLDLIKHVMDKMGINDTWYRFSKWDPKNERNKYVDNSKAWEETQRFMKKILDKLDVKYVEADGEAAFYGPKLDLQFKDVYGKEDTLFTVQIDFALPEKFNLTYTDKKGEEKRVMIIHRSSIGSPERTLSHLLELTQGKFPLWLSPNQIKVLTLNDDAKDYANQIYKDLFNSGYQVEINDKSESMGKKAREASIQQFNYILTVGEQEMKENKVAIKKRDSKEIQTMNLEEFKEKLQKEISEKTL